MSEYIKREDFEHTLVNEMPNIQPLIPNAIAVDVAKKLSEMIPSADVVEVVRCKDCKYWKSNTEFCEFWSALNVAQRTCKNDYCSYGEREDGEEE